MCSSDLSDRWTAPHGISIHSLRMEGDSLRMEGDGAYCTAIRSDLPMEGDHRIPVMQARRSAMEGDSLRMEGDRTCEETDSEVYAWRETPSAWRETETLSVLRKRRIAWRETPSAWRETAKLHRKAFFISPILVQSCKKGCKRLHSAPEKMVFFEKREKNLVRNLQHLSVRL